MKYTNKDKELVRSLLVIRNKGICHTTHWRAVQEFNRVKFDLEKRVGTGPIIYLALELLDIDPDYPDGYSYWSPNKTGFASFVDRIICTIAPEKEALKYTKEYRPLSSYYDSFRGWDNCSWMTVDRCYKYAPWDEVRHDDVKTAKWRKYNNY